MTTGFSKSPLFAHLKAILIFSIAMGAEYFSCVKSIATFAPTFYGYIISVLASVNPEGNDSLTPISPPVFSRSVNPISTRGTDYICPPK